MQSNQRGLTPSRGGFQRGGSAPNIQRNSQVPPAGRGLGNSIGGGQPRGGSQIVGPRGGGPPQGGGFQRGAPGQRASAWKTGDSSGNITRRSQKAAGGARLDALFYEFDEDKSGFISAAELRMALQKKYGLFLDHDNATLLLHRFDENFDGEISKEEFCNIIEFVLDLKKKFEELDVDGSKAISNEELVGFVQRIGLHLPSTIVGTLAKIFDDDDSGEIEFQEFFNLMLYVQELEYQYDKRYKQSKSSDTQWVVKLLGQTAADRELITYLERNKNLTLSEFFEAIIQALGRNKSVQKAPKVLKVRNNQKTKAPKLPCKIKRSHQRFSVKQSNYTRNAPFSDPEFPATGQSLGKLAHKVSSWKRVTEITRGARLFVDGVDEGDVIQGELGNCWFLGALSLIAASGNEFVEDLFVLKNFEGGHFVCKFYKDGAWVKVEIDDRIPCNSSGRPAFASCADPNEFWVPLIEKAYAKLHGGYDTIESGAISYALKDLTGEAVEHLQLDEPATLPCNPGMNNLWDLLVDNIKESHLMGCSIISSVALPEEKNSFNLLLNHAYSLIDCQSVLGNKLIRLRNPWGNYEWNGRWSDGAAEWTPELMRHFGNYEFANDGTFFMCFEDFTRFFNSIHVLRLLTDDVGDVWQKESMTGEWTEATAGGFLSFPTWAKNPQIKITAINPNTRVFVCLSQEDIRYHGKNQKHDVFGLTVLKGDRRSAGGQKKISFTEQDKLKTSVFYPGRDVSLEFTIAQPGDNGHAILIPCFFQPNIRSQFNILMYSQHPATFQMLSDQPNNNARQQSMRAGPGNDQNKFGSNPQGSNPYASGNFSNNNQGGYNQGGGQGGFNNAQAYAPTNSVDSQWTMNNSGGCMNHPTWINNPQFIMKCDRECEVTVTLTQYPEAGQPVEYIGMYLFDASKLHGYRLGDMKLHPGEKIQFINMPSVSAVIKVPNPSMPLLLLPATFEPGKSIQFNVTVDATVGNATLRPAKDWKEGSFAGQWVAGQAGGCMNHRSWQQNPSYVLSLNGNGPMTFDVALSVPNPLSTGLGFYLFEDKLKNGVPSLLGLIGHPPFAVRSLTNIFTFKDIQPGRYVILPCTFEPNHLSPFYLTILGTTNFTLSK